MIEECLVVDSTNSGIVDSGATNHICNSLQVLQLSKMLSIGDSGCNSGPEGQSLSLGSSDGRCPP